MVLRVGVPLHIDVLLPLAEVPQSVVGMVCDLQILLGVERVVARDSY